MNDVCFLVYTNEKYLPIADLTTNEHDRFDHYSAGLRKEN